MRTAALDLRRAARPGDAPTMRRAAKTINFGVIYGMGDSALAKQLGIPRERGGALHRGVLRALRGRRALHGEDASRPRARARRCARSSGAGASCRTCTRPTAALRFEAERIAQNTPIQGTAADILKLAMVDLGRERRRRRARAWCSPCTTSSSSRCPRRRRDGGGGAHPRAMAGRDEARRAARRRRRMGQELGRGPLELETSPDTEGARRGRVVRMRFRARSRRRLARGPLGAALRGQRPPRLRAQRALAAARARPRDAGEHPGAGAARGGPGWLCDLVRSRPSRSPHRQRRALRSVEDDGGSPRAAVRHLGRGDADRHGAACPGPHHRSGSLRTRGADHRLVAGRGEGARQR